MTMEVENQAQTALSSSPIYALRDLRVERNGTTLLFPVESARFTTSNWPRKWCEVWRMDCRW